jgi:hypothetical protein
MVDSIILFVSFGPQQTNLLLNWAEFGADLQTGITIV